jgi:hypothetical protein
MVKQKVILVGPFVGELYWEFFRFAPYVFKQNDRNYPLVVLTRPDRYDIYGDRAIEFIPLTIKGDSTKRFGECFKMIGLEIDDYKKIADTFRQQMELKYKIVDHFIPPFKKPMYLDKDYYPISHRLFDYKPRSANKKLVDDFLKNVTKPIVILAPRYRKNFKRNWPHWNEFYDKIERTKWNDKFEFIICGKENEYVPDKKNRFLDINQIQMNKNSSLFGLLLEIIGRATLTVGSQSAIPNISLLKKVKAIEWGNQRHLHTVTYNVYKVPVRFLDSPKFDIDVCKVFNTMVVELTQLMHK